MDDIQLRALARRMREQLSREIDQQHVDVADLMPYLREAAGDETLRDAFAQEAATRGDVGMVLWSLLDPETQYRTFLRQVQNQAQLSERLRTR